MDEVESLQDAGLRAAVREHLRGLPHGADSEGLSEIVVDEVTVLDGIERFHGLRRLGLEGTDVVDLRPLAGLRDMEELWLSETRVADLRPLSGLQSLTVLELGDTPVVDIEPLRPLRRLQKLWLNGSNVTDLDPIRALTGLVTVGVAGAPIEDYRPLEALRSCRPWWSHGRHPRASGHCRTVVTWTSISSTSNSPLRETHVPERVVPRRGRPRSRTSRCGDDGEARIPRVGSRALGPGGAQSGRDHRVNVMTGCPRRESSVTSAVTP